MNFELTSKRVIKNLLREHNLRPLKRLGQNFLISRITLKKLVESAELKPQDIVLEIGPGIGTLTLELAKQVKKVIAVEKDPRMVEILKETLQDFSNVEILQDDILSPNFQFSIFNFPYRAEPSGFRQSIFNFQFSNYKVVSNLPYNIATEVIRKFLESKKPPKLMVVMVQKEVGKRICSCPPKMQRLGVLVQALADAKIIKTVKKDCFWPQPKVDSVILKIIPQKNINKFVRSHKFVNIVKAGFSHPRKQLINNFSKTLNLPREKVEKWLGKNDIEPQQRAESLSVQDWLNLTKRWL